MREPSKDPHKWKTKEGQLIPIVKMEDSHLTNTIRMLHRQAPAIHDIQMLEAYSMPEPRGEMAQLSVEQGLRSMERQEEHETLDQAFLQYRHLAAEAYARKLPIVQEFGFDDDWTMEQLGIKKETR